MAFQREELTAIILLGAISGIVVSIGDLLSTTATTIHITTNPGLIILALSIVGMIISVYVHEFGHRYFGKRIGYITNIESYTAGHVIGLVLSLFTFGFIQFFTPNTADLEADPVARIHKHRKIENPRQQAFVALSGILTTAVFATCLHGAYVLSGANEVLHNVLLGNIFLMIYSMVPFELLSLYSLKIQRRIDQIPESDGLYIFHYSFFAYVTVAAFVLTLGAILAFTASVPVWIALLVGAFVGTFVWFKYFLESN